MQKCGKKIFWVDQRRNRRETVGSTWLCGAVVAGSREMEEDKVWLLVLYRPAQLGPEAINYSLIEGYR